MLANNHNLNYFILLGNFKTNKMKKLFLLLFTVSLSAQVPAIVEVEEWVSDNPKKLVEMLNHWTDLEAEQNGV